MLVKKVSYEHSIKEIGIIEIRRITRIYEDGKIIGEGYYRHTISPGDDCKDEDEITKKIANAIYTPEFIAEYESSIEEIV